MFDINKMMRQMQKVQQDMARVQEELGSRTVEASAGGGVVRAVCNGRHELITIEVKREAVDPDDLDMLQDLIVAAVNEALRKAREMMAQEMSRLTGGLNLPGFPPM